MFENSQRELKTTNSTVESMKAQNKDLLKHYRDLILKKSLDYELQISKLCMVSEDYYSNCCRLELKISSLFSLIDQKARNYRKI